jgi:hypothetical protein
VVPFDVVPQDVIVLSICNRPNIGEFCGTGFYPPIATEEWFCPDVISFGTAANCAEVTLRPFDMGP